MRLARRSALALGLIIAPLLGMVPSIVPDAAQAQVALPFSQNDVLLGSPSSEVAFTADLFTLPARGELIAQAVPDDAHLDMSLVVEISGCTLVNPFGSCPASRTSPPGTGPRTAVYEAYGCVVPNANNSNYFGKTCRVAVRATSFGQAGPPATFDLAIRGETEVPWSTIVGSVSTSVPTVSANIPTSTAPFINEGTNFRWIYDLDHDDVLFTPVVGRCEITNTGGTLLPYTYQFQGNPTYQGLDCCTWQIDSSTGVTGTGQALFFVNVDASNPANQPGDADLDGIKDLCDNCRNAPNGPLLGSCVGGTKAGLLCRSSQRCPGGTCSLAQDDLNLDGVGNVCVPEPGVDVGILGGGLLLVVLFGASVRRRSASATDPARESECARSW